ncbi:hypothetical protein [Hydrogenophaga sp. IBVHS1]|jgi:hypothetical protein|uniref:hypothetical protein n=1 Tax=unclassified Hydrogenophaga TaxID=2610897 RepID=UPI000A2E79A4|nr:hypothetical protein [Hydrogenophaga sp. IBVHS1]OSZ72962.1 hypothetical protein CAP37_14905 [Hydrogenophaga sp. IBVHS1]
MNLDVQSANILVPSESAEPELVQAGKVALTFLEETGQSSRNQAAQIFHLMAKLAVERGDRLPYIEYETGPLKDLVAPASAKGASAWMSPLWKQLEKLQSEWEPGLKATAIQRGFAFMPRLQKLQGSPVRYQLVAELIGADEGELHQTPAPEGGLRYTPAAVAAPGALLLAGLRNGVLRNTLPLVISAGISVLLVLAFVVLSGWWIFVLGLRWNAPLTTAHISILALWCFAAWTVMRLFNFLGQLADLGIVMAPEFLVPFKADHVTLELRPKQGDKKGEFAFVRYTASCPLCAGLVLLQDGGDEFKGRIVGRCDNSPREHVYSFDQKLHVGRSMRGQ